MRDINVVVLVGRLTRDSELRYLKSGMPISRFSIAVNRSKKDGDQWVDEASFFEIDFYGKGAEAVNRYLTKGQQVGVEGELRQDRWEQDGAARSKVVVNASNVRLLGNQGGKDGPGSTQPPQDVKAHPARQADAVAQVSDTFEDDIPF